MVQADRGGRSPWGNPMGAAQFGASFFMITGFHGLHVSAGVIMLLIVASKVARGHYTARATIRPSRSGPLLHFVDLVWVFISHSSTCGEGSFMNHAPVPDASHHADLVPIHEVGQQHPLGVYFKCGGCCSCSARCPTRSIFPAEGVVRWGLILTFMILKAV